MKKVIIKKILGTIILVIGIPLFLYSLLVLVSSVIASFNLKISTGIEIGLLITIPIFLISSGLLIIAKNLLTGRL